MFNTIGNFIFYIILCTIAFFGLCLKSLHEQKLIEEYGINSAMAKLILVRHYGSELAYTNFSP